MTHVSKEHVTFKAYTNLPNISSNSTYKTNIKVIYCQTFMHPKRHNTFCTIHYVTFDFLFWIDLICLIISRHMAKLYIRALKWYLLINLMHIDQWKISIRSKISQFVDQFKHCWIKCLILLLRHQFQTNLRINKISKLPYRLGISSRYF